jgi:single-stranded DNA-binding protein
MYTMNQITIIGFTGSDAEAHYTQNGTPRCGNHFSSWLTEEISCATDFRCTSGLCQAGFLCISIRWWLPLANSLAAWTRSLISFVTKCCIRHGKRHGVTNM